MSRQVPDPPLKKIWIRIRKSAYRYDGRGEDAGQGPAVRPGPRLAPVQKYKLYKGTTIM